MLYTTIKPLHMNSLYYSHAQEDNQTMAFQKNVLADYISDAVVFTDIEYRILYVNNRAEQLYGIKATEAIGKRLSEFIEYEYINGSREEALATLIDTGSWQGKLVFIREGDRKKFYLLATVTYARNEEAKAVGLIATLKDITTEELMNEKARSKSAEQQKLINQMVIKAQENERNELGRELHDNINQILAAVKLQLEFGLDNYEEEKATIERCKANIEEVINEIRKLSHRLVLPRFAETTLQSELHKTIDNICHQQSVQLVSKGLNEKNIPDNIKETLYRIAQEQLTNIIKHAKAAKAVITLHNDTTAVYMCIEDNGIGFALSHSRKGVGINNILNRVESYGGTALLFSEPGCGCRLQVTIPLKNNCEPD